MAGSRQVAVIGGGPAGLMAAERLAVAGCRVTVYDRMASVGRKFLMAGRGGLNLTHAGPMTDFMPRYGAAAARLQPLLEKFPPPALTGWCEGLGQPVFTGSSGHVFPTAMKASPLLRAWLRRLTELKVQFALQRRWIGWDSQARLLFATNNGQVEAASADATLLALGGASWPKLGADGGWVGILTQAGIPVTPLRPTNCGFTVGWSELFQQRFAGTPVKPVRLSFGTLRQQGEAMITATGIEGGAVYALSAALREAIAAEGTATVYLDLKPGVSTAQLLQKLSMPRGSQSLATYLRKAAGLAPVAIALMREAGLVVESTAGLAEDIKACPIILTGTAGLERAISTAGGVSFAALDQRLMVNAQPGLFVAGEMLDWEAPTGGYLLQGCFSSAVTAADGMLDWLRRGA